MDFLDQFSRLYLCPLTDKEHDPLRLRHQLVQKMSGGLWLALGKRRAASLTINDPAIPLDDPKMMAAEADLANTCMRLADAARIVFSLPDKHLTDAESLAALDIYLDWCELKKTPPSQSSSS